MSSGEDFSEAQVPAGLSLAVLLSVIEGHIDNLGFVKGGLAGPFKGFGPGLVAKEVADEVSVTSIDENGDLLENAGDHTVEWLHPVTLEQEISVDVKVAGIIAANFGTKSLLDFTLVQEVADPSESSVAEVARILALATNIVNVLAGALVRANEVVVAVDCCRNARPDALAIVARLNKLLASRKSVIHRLTLALIENAWPRTLSASHWSVVLILDVRIGQTISDKRGFDVDVSLLVGKDLGGEDGDVVTGIRLTRDVEILLGILWELLEEEGQ